MGWEILARTPKGGGRASFFFFYQESYEKQYVFNILKCLYMYISMFKRYCVNAILELVINNDMGRE